MIIRFLRFLLVVGAIYFFYRWILKSLLPAHKEKKRGEETPPHNSNTSNHTPPSTTVPGIIAEMKKDPVCGTYVPENQAVVWEMKGTVHYFCSQECMLKFQELPE